MSSFWTPKQQDALDAAAAEAFHERQEMHAARLRTEAATRARLDEMKPVADKASLALVSAGTRKRLEQECGQPITGIKVLSEKGRMFSDKRRFTTALPMLPFIFSNTFGVNAAYVREDAGLFEHVYADRAAIPRASIPHIVTDLDNVVSVNIDAAAVDHDYITDDEAARLARVYRVEGKIVDYLRAMAREATKRQPAWPKAGTFSVTILPPAQMDALNAIRIVSIGDSLRLSVVHIMLPPSASEYFAEHVLIFIIKHIIAVLFGAADKDTPLEIAKDFTWCYVFAVHHKYLSDGSHELTLFIGKRMNSPGVVKMLEREHELKLEAMKAAEEASMAHVAAAKKLAEKPEEEEEDEEEEDSDDEARPGTSEGGEVLTTAYLLAKEAAEQTESMDVDVVNATKTVIIK
jgi:hypothetical protein